MAKSQAAMNFSNSFCNLLIQSLDVLNLIWAKDPGWPIPFELDRLQQYQGRLWGTFKARGCEGAAYPQLQATWCTALHNFPISVKIQLLLLLRWAWRLRLSQSHTGGLEIPMVFWLQGPCLGKPRGSSFLFTEAICLSDKNPELHRKLIK